ncbi:helix-turn-helix domain-containing protein [Mycobacterium sp. NAZ190054]|uniref:helix-turn-helix domain-containing protein n=1 Tax=Mycobacterium sp. NAZ190054 TaxID=1747766 RepID=UPI000792D3F5|nr:helix-turn-helix domain-containing protein [Mycobacterium sp. NAZ190054]KWX56737.1 AraC family transcriptional regulator [Mycobacterium sp. NAZ190054]
MHTVAILAYDGMSGFESGLAAEIFGMTELSEQFSAGLVRPWYKVKLCSEQQEIRLVGGAVVRTSYGLDDLAAADTVVIPSVRDVTAPTSPELVEAIKTADARDARLVSICSGAFALAAAGILDGRKATTHWIYTELLQERYPGIDIDPAPLYVDNGRVLTSAGCAAGLDLCLHIVRSDHGGRVANDVARRLVISPHRAGGQAQYIEVPVPEPMDDGRIAAGMTWAMANLDRPITLDEMAEQSMMSRRSYLRQFAKATGTTPIKWLITQRIQASLALLEATSLSIEQIAVRVGFESPSTFRHHFVRQMQTTPSDYRSAFTGQAV